MSLRFFDSHAHLDGERLLEDLSQVLERAAAVGITDIVCIGASSGFESNTRALAIAEREDEASGIRLFATMGVHPHDAAIVDAACLDAIRALADHEKVVGIGETGLDYHYDHAPRDVQRAIFRAFLGIARDLHLPTVVHTREAEDDTIEVLRSEHAEQIGGVIHCFTGTEKLAHAALDLGFYVSFSGVLTFKNAENLRSIAKALPRDRVLVETDCPYLAPVPYRGKPNEPAWVVKTAEALAALWGISLEETKATTGENAARLFNR